MGIYQFVVKAATTPGPIRRQSFDGKQRVEVRDLSIRVNLQVRAEEVSPYRHNLLLDGDEYQILNVIQQH